MASDKRNHPGSVTLFGVLLASLVCTAGTSSAASRLERLDCFGQAYPRAFFFRQCEGMAAGKNVSYARWEATFERLMGIQGKVLDEEVVGRSARNIDFFTRFKRLHPEQLVLLHFNGNARDPRWQSARFFAGHWLYYNGTRIVSAVPAEGGVTEIEVADPRLFRVNMGRYRDKNEDIGLCLLDAAGRPDWSRSEQVQLVSIDVKRKTIRVRRGCFGTTPRAFPAGQSYAAAHMTEGPWGARNHLLWFYNYATCCPRDAEGRTCTDVLIAHLTELFGPAGALAAFDGLEFDVLHHECAGGGRARGADCDADGRIDRGHRDGLNLYGIGVVEFCRELRRRLGDDRLILADGMGLRNQRAFGLLNGIESEGWPHLSDAVIRDWSGGLNRHFFWDRNARRPQFNYINHKFMVSGDAPGVRLRPEVPFSTHRLVFAVATFTNSAICYSFSPRNDPDGLFGVWDEFRMGTENELGWLGKPLGPPVRPAIRQQELLKMAGGPIGRKWLARFDGPEARVALDGGAVRVEARDPNVSSLGFHLRDVPCVGPDLVVLVTARGAPLCGYPAEVARLMHVAAVASGKQSTRELRFMTWVNEEEFESGFYFSDISSTRVDLEFAVEGPEPIWIDRVEVYAHPDVLYREFERGLVLANPSPRPYTFELSRLLPGRRLRRLRGTATQDPNTNDGSAVGDRVTLGGKDGLFLIKAQAGGGD